MHNKLIHIGQVPPSGDVILDGMSKRWKLGVFFCGKITGKHGDI